MQRYYAQDKQRLIHQTITSNPKEKYHINQITQMKIKTLQLRESYQLNLKKLEYHKLAIWEIQCRKVFIAFNWIQSKLNVWNDNLN